MQHPIFDKLLTVRTLRTEKAQRKMMHRKAILMEARQIKARKEQELVRYRKWRAQKERRLLEELKQAPRQAYTLIEFNEKVSNMRYQEASHAQTAAEAAQKVAKAEAELQSSRRDYAAAYRKQVKIEMCKASWVDEQRLIVEREAEKETESSARMISADLDNKFARSF
jgi:hypothetical protein